MILTFGLGRSYEPPTMLFQPFVEIVGMRSMYANMFKLSDI